MTVPAILTLICFMLLMIVGGFVSLYSLLRLTKTGGTPSELSLPGIKVQLKGPAWLVLVAIGAVMLASPIIAAALQQPSNVTIPPASVQNVQKVKDPDYAAFRFVRDVSILDLRASENAPWYSHITGALMPHKKTKVRPSVLKNYMVVRKIAAANTIKMTYGTSGLLDVRCLTQNAKYEQSESIEDGKRTQTWEVVADISSVPVGAEFEVAVEATYWNAFSGTAGDDYSTYSHPQTDPEEVSVILLFPEDKPFKTVAVTEFAPDGSNGVPFQGIAGQWSGPQSHTSYWTTTNRRPGYYYKIAWTW